MSGGHQCNTMAVVEGEARSYLPIENYGMIGNMRTCALVSMDGSVGMFFFFLCFLSRESEQGRPRDLGRDADCVFCVADFMCW